MTPIERAAIRLVDARAEVRNARHELGRVQQALEDPADALARRRAAGFRAAGAMRSLTWAVRKEREAGRAGATLPVAAPGGEIGRVGRGGDSGGSQGPKRHTLVAPISAATIVGAHLTVYPITQLVEVLGVSDKALKRVLSGKRPGAKFARRWRLATGQDLIAAWREFEDWQREDDRLAKESAK